MGKEESSGMLLFAGAVGTLLGVRIYRRFRPKSLQLDSQTGNEFSSSLVPYTATQIMPPREDAPQADFYCERIDIGAALHRAEAFLKLQNQRRSLRYFSTDSFPEELLLNCIATGGTAPSGAHQQPWHFSIVKNAELKIQIRDVVEREEQQNYDKRMKKTWLDDLTPLFKDSGLHKNGQRKETN